MYLELDAINPYRLKINEYPGRLFPLDDDTARDLAQLRELLSTTSEVYCEIGSGSGAHMLELGLRSPLAKIFGFELRYKRAVRTIQKAEQRNIGNIYVLRARGENILDYMGPRSVDAIYVNFPDPWEKLKRRKHRVLSAGFLRQMAAVLRPGGVVSVKTDHLEYFQSFIEAVESSEQFVIKEYTENLYHSNYLAANIPTEFEQMFRRQGLPINYCQMAIRES